MLYRAIVRSKLDYGFIVYGTASNTNIRQLNSIHNSGLRLALGAFYTSPVSSVYTEANEAPLEERRLKLSMHYYMKSRACINNPAHHALHEFDQITRDLYIHGYSGRGGMTRPLTPPVGLNVETAMTSAVINSGLFCLLRTSSWWIQNEREGRGSSSCQSPFPEWWDNLPPSVQKNDWQQHHLCYWGYRHHTGTGLLLAHGPSSPRYSSLHWLSVLLAGDWGWRLREPFNLPYPESPLVIERQRHTCSFLLDTKQLWHWGKQKSWPASKRDTGPRYRPSGKCPLCRFEATCQFLHPAVECGCTWQMECGCTWQMECGCTWPRSLSLKTNTGTTQDMKAPNWSGGGCNYLTSNWPYQGHQVPYLVLWTPDGLPPLWLDTDHWP